MDTVPIRYVGPCRRPITIQATGQTVIHEQAPLPPFDGVNEVEHPAVVVDVPPDVAERLLEQPRNWARADGHGRELTEAAVLRDQDHPDGYLAVGDLVSDDDPPTTDVGDQGDEPDDPQEE